MPHGAKHYKVMGSAIWLFSYLLLHADRKTGRLIRKLDTISKERGINKRTIRYWMSKLRQHGYITTNHTGRSLEIFIQKWKPLEKVRVKQSAALRSFSRRKRPEMIAELIERKDRLIKGSGPLT